MRDVTAPDLMCHTCARALPPVPETGSALTCPGCGTAYAVHFGILDLRPAILRVADGTFDREADLAEAVRLDEAFRRMSYREWFFRGVDDRLDEIGDPKFRELMRAYYRVERQTFGKHGGAILEKLDAYLADQEPARAREWRSPEVALEAGCGTGQYPIGFAQRFAHVLVTDISYVSLLQAKKIAADHQLGGVHVFASDIARLPLPDGSVDFVHCNGVIEHVAEPERCVTELGRVLSERGVALILSPNHYSLYTEAHFRVPGFGFWPLPLRRRLAYRLSGAREFTGTRLRSIGELRRYARRAFRHHRVYFLPPRLPAPVRSDPLRRMVHAVLRSPLRRPAAFLINRALLGVVPYHVLLGFKR